MQRAHTGYTARLWKTVSENGTVISRDAVNKSTYAATPRTATVGIATANEVYAARMQAAIATGSIDTVKAEVAAIKAEEAYVAEQQKLMQSVLGVQQQLQAEEP